MDIPVKIVLVGDSGVGKSSLIVRYCKDTFQPSHYTTIGIDLNVKRITLPGGHTVTLQLFDTAGQERFRSLSKSFYRNAHVVMLVYDCGRKDSFEHLSSWLEEVDQICPESTKRVMLGNKCDLEAAVDPDEAEAFSTKADAPLFLVSAKTGSKVHQAFQYIVNEVLDDPPQVVHSTPLHPENSGSYCCGT